MTAVRERVFQKRRSLDREADIQRRCVDLYRSLGFKVWQLSQYRPSGQTAGLPDLVVKHRGGRLSFSHELKGPEGRVSEEQAEYAELAGKNGEKHIVGGYDVAVAFLTSEGIIGEGFQG